MPKASPTLGNLAAEVAETDDAEPGARELEAEGVLPAAGADLAVFGNDVAGQREDQAPGELGGRSPQATGASHFDAELATRVEVDRRVGHPGRDEQLEAGARLEQLTRERRAFTHRDDDRRRRAARRPSRRRRGASVRTSRS